MKKLFFIIITFLLISNCTLNKVVKHHGVHSLEKKQSKLMTNSSNKNDKKILQELYDYIFRQVELSIREIGYGDQSINKKMKDYINLFHSMLSEIHFWRNLSRSEKHKKISFFLTDFNEIDDLLDYFELFD